ncbi:serine hydrolase domain-containing protein [Streptomyces virginiae]|uniref:serine hydrolase domain-containing protein n=1 Tax=Streptomyces virginiae TaxID=1961 RepID=UPI002DBC71CA|nr:serine hydrolase domain-containing protein [Streptomyces sp. CMAA1738]MEC4570722.1 serine hydrolase domain-containing protein [Streptomyces sp. CMAA1738]
MRHSRTFTLTCLGGLMLAASLAAGGAAGPAGSSARQCPAGQVSRGGTCLPGDTEEFTARQVADALKKYKLTAAMAGVWVDGQRVSTAAAGETMTGFPATTDMRFRIGSVAIPYMTTELLKLVDEGKVALDDKLSRWRPDLPHADEITLKMLASASSGYADYVTDKAFIAALYENPFRHWTGEELVRIAVSRPMARPPGSGFAYSHANWVLLGDIISKVERRPLGEVMRENVLEPMGLTATAISSKADIPAPVLHGFDNERGVFEDSTYWNPSWTVAEGAVMTATLQDMAKSFAAIGEGKLLTPESHELQLTPVVKVKGDASFALGLPVVNTWILQNPSFAGYAGTVAYLPSRKLAIATVATQGLGSTVQNASTNVLQAIAGHLAPERPLSLG